MRNAEALKQGRFTPGGQMMTRAQRLSAEVRMRKSMLRHGLAQGRVSIEQVLAAPECRRMLLEDVVRLALANPNVRLDTRRPPGPSGGYYRARRMILNAGANPDLRVAHCGGRQLHDVIVAVNASRLYTVRLRAGRDL